MALKALLGTKIPEMNAFIKNTFPQLEVVEAVDFAQWLSQATSVDLAIISVAFQPDEMQLVSGVAGVRKSNQRLKILYLAGNEPQEPVMKKLRALGVEIAAGENITPRQLQARIESLVAPAEKPPAKSGDPGQTAGKEAPAQTPSPAISTTDNAMPSVAASDIDEAEERHGRVIAVWSPSSEGATTIATSLAYLIGKDGNHRVGLLDFNLKKPDLRTFSDADRTKEGLDDLLPVLVGGSLTPALLSHYMFFAYNAHWLLGTRFPERAEEIELNDMRRIIRTAKQAYPITLVDAGSKLDNAATLAALYEADKVILVLGQSLASIRFARYYLFELFGPLGIGRQKVEMVLNRYDSRAALVPREAEVHLEATFRLVLPYLPDAISAPAHGKPLGVDPENREIQNWNDLLSVVAADLLAETPLKAVPFRRTSWLQRIVGRKGQKR